MSSKIIVYHLDFVHLYRAKIASLLVVVFHDHMEHVIRYSTL